IARVRAIHERDRPRLTAVRPITVGVRPTREAHVVALPTAAVVGGIRLGLARRAAVPGGGGAGGAAAAMRLAGVEVGLAAVAPHAVAVGVAVVAREHLARAARAARLRHLRAL